MEEIWKPVVDAVGVYEVSDHGHLRCVIESAGHRKRLMKPWIKNRYHNYRYLRNNGQYRYVGIQRIMMEAFVPVPEELKQYVGTRRLQVNHKDENPSNNVLENLEWCSAKYNTNYGTAMERKQKTRNESGARGAMVAVNQLSEDGKIIKAWGSLAEASAALGIHKSQICTCCKGKTKTAGGYKWEYACKKGTFEHTIETREKMKAAGLANPHRKGKHLTPEQVEKNRKAHKGIPVGQYSLDGKLIKKWRCAPDAARFLHLDSASIHHVCRGERHSKTLGGFIWKYLD